MSWKIWIWIAVLMTVAISVGFVLGTSKNERKDSSILARDSWNQDNLRWIAISMPARKQDYFDKLQNDFRPYNVYLEFVEGINGKLLDWASLPLSPRYHALFQKNQFDRDQGLTTKDYRGHLGCTLAHLSVLRSLHGPAVIMEDDILLGPSFLKMFQTQYQALTELDPEWDIWLLGGCCRYNDHVLCQENDQEPIWKPGLVRLRYFFGAWAYVIRSERVAQALLQEFEPVIPWHIDLTMAEAARQGRLRIYGSVPTLVDHPGWLRYSSFDYNQIGDIQLRPIRSDTNN
jgi:GR25 family glycosyltransferase involved in LPS biosynthesis